jgi:hypothetical protein
VVMSSSCRFASIVVCVSGRYPGCSWHGQTPVFFLIYLC